MKGIFKALGYFILYLAVSILVDTLLTILFMGVGAASGLKDEKLIIEFANNNILGLSIISGILVVLIFYFVFKIRKKDIKSEWKLNAFQLKDLLLPAILAFSSSSLFALIAHDIPMDSSLMISNSVKYYSGILPMLGFFMRAIFTLLVAPVSEEIVFRGIIYTRAEKTGNPLAAILVSSLFFGCMHFSEGGVVLAIGAILMGAIFGYIFYKYDSLWICMICHCVANSPDFDRIELSDNLMLALKVLFAAIFITSFYFMAKKVKKSDS